MRRVNNRTAYSLKGSFTFPPSGRNLLLALRMKLARTLYEFMTHAPRLPVAITYNIDGRELPENIETSERSADRA